MVHGFMLSSRKIVKKMRKSLIVLLAMPLLLSCRESFDRRLQREAREFTENKCPMEPEPGTLLDSTVYDPKTRVYTRWFSLSPQNEAAVLANAPLLHRNLVRQLAGDVDFKAVKEKGVTFRYVYRSQSRGEVVYETLVKAEEYGR